MTRPLAWRAPALLSGPASVTAQTPAKSSVRAGRYEVPVAIARPAGSGPFAPVPYVHARRGFADDDRAHVRELAAHGFIVLAPDWQRANMIERWPDRHHPETADDVEAGLDALLARKDVSKGPVGVVALSRGPYFAIRLATKRPRDIAAIVSCYGRFQNPNASDPQQLFSVAPEVNRISAPVLMLIGDADFELRRIANGALSMRCASAGSPSGCRRIRWHGARSISGATPHWRRKSPNCTRERTRQGPVRHMRSGADVRCRSS